jgi:hypothetical protein
MPERPPPAQTIRFQNRGQVLDAASGEPVMRPCAAVDFELEMVG